MILRFGVVCFSGFLLRWSENKKVSFEAIGVVELLPIQLVVLFIEFE